MWGGGGPQSGEGCIILTQYSKAHASWEYSSYYDLLRDSPNHRACVFKRARNSQLLIAKFPLIKIWPWQMTVPFHSEKLTSGKFCQMQAEWNQPKYFRSAVRSLDEHWATHEGCWQAEQLSFCSCWCGQTCYKHHEREKGVFSSPVAVHPFILYMCLGFHPSDIQQGRGYQACVFCTKNLY